MSALAEISELAAEKDITAGPAAEAPDGVEFTNLLTEALGAPETGDTPARAESAGALKRRKLELQSRMVQIILNRTGLTANGSQNAGARAFSQALNWFSESTGARQGFLSQMMELSAALPDAVSGVLNAIGELQQTLQKYLQGSPAFRNGAYASVTSFSMDFTAAVTARAGGTGEDYRVSSQDEDLPIGLTRGSRITVQMEIKMRQVEYWAAQNPAPEGSSRTVTVMGQEVDLYAYMLYMDPLVLDLDGDGLDLKAAEDGVVFDLNGDGTAEKCGFVRGDDALLFFDRDGDGRCTNGKELFGDQNGSANGFDELRLHDDNGDGVINAQDEIFLKLRTWNDWNGDGVCDANEVRTLAEAGVAEISLDYRETQEANNGNVISQRASFTTTAGEKREAADALFRVLDR